MAAGMLGTASSLPDLGSPAALNLPIQSRSQVAAAPGSPLSNVPRTPLATAPGSPLANQGGNPSKTRTLSGKRRAPQFTQNQFYTKPFDIAYEDLAKARNLRKLEVLFFEADTDGSGEMSLDEFREALRMPRIQRAFAALGVQPHQSELVFKSLDKRKTGELSITEFMTGLTEMVGTDIDGTGRELDIETLRPSYKAKQKFHSHSQFNIYPVRSQSAPTIKQQQTSSLGLGPVHLLPKVKVQRAFVHSASAQALHSATATRQQLKLIFPF